MARVFISYSSKDKSFVADLADNLRTDGVEVWFDDWEIKVGHSLVEKINEGMESSDCLLLVLSPSSVVSRWVQEELSAAYALAMEMKITILPLLIAKCDIPPLLKNRRYADYSQNPDTAYREVLAAIKDIRGNRISDEAVSILNKYFASYSNQYSEIKSGAEADRFVDSLLAEFSSKAQMEGFPPLVYRYWLMKCLEEARYISSIVDFINIVGDDFARGKITDEDTARTLQRWLLEKAGFKR